MDWGRFMRAVGAEHIETLETKRKMHLGQMDKFSESEWNEIIEHDRLAYGE